MSEERTISHADPVVQAGFTQIPRAVLFDASLSFLARLLYGALKSYAWASEDVWPGQEILADQLGVSSRHLRDAGNELRDHGLITVKRRGGGMTNLYIIQEPRNHSSNQVPKTGTTVPILTGTTVPTKYTKKENVESANTLSTASRGKTERKNDVVWDALATLFGEVTSNGSRGKRNIATAEIKQALKAISLPEDKWANEIIVRSRRYPQLFPGAALTDRALSVHWDQLSSSVPAGLNGEPAPPRFFCPKCGVGKRTEASLTDHVELIHT